MHPAYDCRWLLNEIIDEMGEVNCGQLADCFKIIIRNLLTEPQVIIVDEVDYLAIDSRAIETLSDIHDKTNVPTHIFYIKKEGIETL